MAMKEVSYGQAMNRKYPEQIGWAVSLRPDGRPNVIVLGWVMPASGAPPMIAISVGHTRYSHECIRKCGEFVVVFPAVGQEEATMLCGTKSGRDVDKFNEAGLQAIQARKVKPPLVDGAVANFECRLVGECEAGDHTIFVGEVVAAHVNEDACVERLYNFSGDFLGACPAK